MVTMAMSGIAMRASTAISPATLMPTSTTPHGGGNTGGAAA
jgi:hypothetical protein